MKNKKGITLIAVVITVVVWMIVAGITNTTSTNTFENSQFIQFETYMKTLQKKVDIALEEGKSYNTLGSALTGVQKATLQNIIDNDSNNYIETNDTSEEKLRYFSTSDIENIFDISDVNDDIVINFSNREVISLNGVKKDGVMHYVEKGL